MDRKLFIAVLAGLVMVVAIIRVNNQKTNQPIVETPTPTIGPAHNGGERNLNYEPYLNEEVGIQLKHPKEIIPEVQEDGSVTLIKTGPSQTEGTEFFDGIVLGFKRNSLLGTSLENKVNEDMLTYKDLYGEDEVSEVKEIKIGMVSGFMFTDSRGEYIYLPLNGDYLEIVNLTADPGNLGYTQTANEILNSLELL